jgi:DNA-binding response OmpR family regulator
MTQRVLLVEDDEFLGVLFELALSDAGYTVARARSGMEALSKLAAEAPRVDVVVTDINLGEGPDGWQVARRARARQAGMPVVYMTGAAADDWAPQHVPYGVLLLKPFEVEQLVKTVGELVGSPAGPVLAVAAGEVSQGCAG